MFIKTNPIQINNFDEEEYADSETDINLNNNMDNNIRNYTVVKQVFTGAIQSVAKASFENLGVSYPAWVDTLIGLAITGGGVGVCILVGVVAFGIFFFIKKVFPKKCFQSFER